MEAGPRDTLQTFLQGLRSSCEVCLLPATYWLANSSKAPSSGKMLHQDRGSLLRCNLEPQVILPMYAPYQSPSCKYTLFLRSNPLSHAHLNSTPPHTHTQQDLVINPGRAPSQTHCSLTRLGKEPGRIAESAEATASGQHSEHEASAPVQPGCHWLPQPGSR